MKWLALLLFLPYTAHAITAASLTPTLTAASSQSFSAGDTVSLSPTGNLSITGWMKITALPVSGNSMSVVGKWTDVGSQDSWLMQFHNPSGTQQIRFLNTTTGTDVGLCTFNYTAETGVWHYWDMEYTAATPLFEIFVDGISVGSCTGTLKTSIFDSTGTTIIGADNGTNFVSMTISNWRIWKSVRANVDYASNACNALGVTTNLSAEWSLDNVVTDNSGNGNTLTNNGSIPFANNVPTLCAASAASFQLWPLSLF